MNKDIYPLFYQIEKNHWWFRARRKILFDIMGRLADGKFSNVLDIGCGTGINFSYFKRIAENVTGLDAAEEAVEFAKSQAAGVPIIHGSFPDIEIPGRFSLITLFDVLEHIEDDVAALKKASSLLEDDGYIVLTVPAYQFLWSDHDEVLQHKRRYTKEMLLQKAMAAGLTVRRLSYFSAIFFLPICLFRFAKKILGLKKSSGDMFDVPKVLNAVMGFIFGLEKWLLRVFNFPFGVSILCVFQKQEKNKS